MNAVMRRWYGDMLDHSPDLVEMMPSYVANVRTQPRFRFIGLYRQGRPGGWWGVKRAMGHRAFGVRFVLGLGRFGADFGIWPVWAMRFEGWWFPPAESVPAEASVHPRSNDD